ncbi:protein ASPARTIC PROTEASE IN GUARD CELL 1-like [Phalaenopsis equestris]|uniref:protein ASPARTIC PROTEASE IN GUARD CELL 1-like n=1 Tax=Phalaenopsis equestris TaxID=78828 RepID=UPI0009E1A8FB|nr:protein ASPARTIC PROTEASE IN GUARD CELL 1-like [Phalaenopsis equestris]
MSKFSRRLSSKLLPFFLCTLLPLYSSRLLSPRNIAVLDVTASIQKAAAVIAFDSQRAHVIDDETMIESMDVANSSNLSIKLHSRDFLPRAIAGGHKDYRSLTLARLGRDSTRTQAISARISLAIHGIKKSDLKPLITDDMLETTASGGGGEVSGPVVSGTNQGSGEYFSQVGIGQPARLAYLVIDTGSDVTWIQCQPCTDCYQQSDPVFDPAASSTYSPLSCDSQSCRSLDVSACRNSSCLYQVSYGDGSFTVGEFATDSLTFGSSSPVPSIALGCGHDNEGLFVGASGILGLGGGALSFPSQIQSPSFSYCLVNRDSSSSSTLDFGSKSSDPTTVTAPLLRNSKVDTFYYVGLSGLSVGGEVLSIPASAFAMDESGTGGVIVDSGTAVTRLQRDAYSALREAFSKGMTDLPSAEGVALFDTCYDLSSRTSVEVPTVAFRFDGGKELKLPATNYLIPVDSTGTFCLAFAPTSSPLSIIGNVQQQGTRVAFDLDNALVGFTPNKC